MRRRSNNVLVTAAFILLHVFQPVCPALGSNLTDVHSPRPGSRERREILDEVRSKIRELHRIDVLFRVRKINVSRGWAWVHTSPESWGRKEKYEDFFALLRKRSGKWSVMEIPCTEPDNPECIDDPGYFRRLSQRYPDLPLSIFNTVHTTN